jgi:serine/threonine protein kinase
VNSRNFKIVEPLGRGGTAVIYKAIQTSLDRTVVVKRLHPHLTGDPSFTKRFELEAKTAAGLEHDNIVRVIDFGSSGGSYFIVMEYVEGVTFKDLLERRKRLPVDIALVLTGEVLLGLEHAHAREIVHRDVKPGNLMVSRSGRIKITDFGLAKLGANPLYQTAADSLLGTPLYMSPEQAFGESVDHRSDLFSLGIVLLELLTGVQPFLAETYAGVINKILNCRPEDLSGLLRDVPPAVGRIVLKSLDRNPDRRYQSATEFREDIELYLGEAGVTDRGRRLAHFLRNPKTGVGGPSRTIEEDPEPPVPLSRGRRLTTVALASLMASLALLSALLPGAPSLLFPWAGEADPPPSPGHATVVTADLAPVPSPGDSVAALPARPSLDEGLEAARHPRVEVDRALRGFRPATIAYRPPPRTRTVPRASPEPPSTPPPADPARPSPGWATIHVTPSARISLDGRDYGTTAALEKVTLEPGRHRLRVTETGYQPYEESFWIRPGEISSRSIRLEKLRGWLMLSADPGSALYVDGRFAATLPLDRPLPLASGKHRLSLRKVGYEEWKADVDVPADDQIRIRIRLTPLP